MRVLGKVIGPPFAVGLAWLTACDSAAHPPTESAMCRELAEKVAKAPKYPAKVVSCRKVSDQERATTYLVFLDVELHYPQGSFPHCVSNPSACGFMEGPRVPVGGTWRTTLDLMYHKTSRGWRQ